MVKFARRASFYWLSNLDPEADAYDAINQELLDKEDALRSTIHNVGGNDMYTINGHDIRATDADAAIQNARAAHETLATARRNDVWRSTPHIVGRVGGGLLGAGLGGTAGYWGARALGYKDRGRTVGTVGGALAGALIGQAIGGNIGANLHVNSASHPAINNGKSVLLDLNRDINSHLTLSPTDSTPEFFTPSVADTARDNAAKKWGI